MSWPTYIVRHLVKGIIWACVYLTAARTAGFEPSLRLLLFFLACSFASVILDKFIPTEEEPKNIADIFE